MNHSNQVQNIEKLMNLLFERFEEYFPSNRALFTTDKIEKMKNEWVKAFVNNGVVNVQQIKSGIAHTQNYDSPYMPSLGQFITWCKQDYSPFENITADGLVKKYQHYKADYKWLDEDEKTLFFKSHTERQIILAMNKKIKTDRDLQNIREIAVAEIYHCFDMNKRKQNTLENKQQLIGGV